MSERRYEFDCACEELARHFLSNEPQHARAVLSLAQSIQDAVEEWFVRREMETMLGQLTPPEYVLNDASPVGDEGAE